MAVDRSFVERNRAATDRTRAMARLSEAELRTPVGEHWTVAVVLAHLAFWDRRVLYVLDRSERDGKLSVPQMDIVVNDISLPLWAVVPPGEAARIAVETADALDRRLEALPPALLEELYQYNRRYVERSLHRGEHLDEAAAALKQRQG